MSNPHPKGWFGDPERHAIAGSLGGQKTAATHDQEFYKQIGIKGGAATTGKFKKGDPRASEAGKKHGKG